MKGLEISGIVKILPYYEQNLQPISQLSDLSHQQNDQGDS